jgi:hypothetical protein
LQGVRRVRVRSGGFAGRASGLVVGRIGRHLFLGERHDERPTPPREATCAGVSRSPCPPNLEYFAPRSPRNLTMAIVLEPPGQHIREGCMKCGAKLALLSGDFHPRPPGYTPGWAFTCPCCLKEGFLEGSFEWVLRRDHDRERAQHESTQKTQADLARWVANRDNQRADREECERRGGIHMPADLLLVAASRDD